MLVGWLVGWSVLAVEVCCVWHVVGGIEWRWWWDVDGRCMLVVGCYMVPVVLGVLYVCCVFAVAVLDGVVWH